MALDPMKRSDEVGMAIAPLVVAIVASMGFARIWAGIFLFAALFAYLVALAGAWPCVYLLRRWKKDSAASFSVLGLVLSSPFSVLAYALSVPERSGVPAFFTVASVLAAGAIGGLVFWNLSEKRQVGQL